MKLLTTLSLCLFLTACSHRPSQLNLQPHVQVSKAASLGHMVHLQTEDLRPQRFVLAIHHDGQEAAELLASEHNLRLQVEHELQRAWLKQGLVFSDSAPAKLRVDILQLSARAQQSRFKHTVESSIRIKVTFSDAQGSLARQFRSVQQHEAPFGVDLKQQQTNLSTQLSELLGQITQDHTLFTFMESK